MPVITKIVQGKHKDQYDLYLDNQFFSTINDDLIIEFQLIKGKELPNSLVAKLFEEQTISSAYNIALKKLSLAMRSEGEIKQHLRQHNVTSDIIKKVILRLKNKNYLDDQKFAQLYLKELINTSHFGPRVVMQKMQQKYLDRDLIHQVLQMFDSNLQKKRIEKEFVKILNNRKSNGSANKFVEKAKLKLARWGYDLDLINQVVSEMDLTQLNDEETDAIEKEGNRLIEKYKNLSESEKKWKIKQTLYRHGYQMENINSFLNYCKF